VPAHYLHSSGNFHLYDPKAKILFSGDIGAALLPESDDSDLYVKDFDRHIEYIEGFHRRWMGSDEAKMDWCERISRYEIDMLCPQHGLIYTGKDVERFINWFSELKVGITRKS
ncbi:MAG TPA: MBL fold metallo-hydrolase, partial [Leptospiraceae bacterium]|nr:MBL fold metallo-hydrolase [Leptospiraceae bacterium]